MRYKLRRNNSDKVVSIRNDDTRLNLQWFPVTLSSPHLQSRNLKNNDPREEGTKSSNTSDIAFY